MSDKKDLVAIPPGKIKCYITGKLRKDTPEEKVRQEIARSLVEEYGYEKNDMNLEFQIKMGIARKKADIVIFYEGRKHIQSNIFLIVETKREGTKPSDRREGIGQLESYLAASLNAKFGIWVGSERIAIEIVVDEKRRIPVTIPDIPPKGETTTPRPTIGSLVPALNLKPVFKRIHNYIHANQGFQKDKAFEELLKLIFIKVYDEQYSPRLEFYFLPGEKTSVLRERLLKVFDKLKKKYNYIFKIEEIIELNNRVLSYSIGELQRFSLVETDTDVKGEAYEEIVGPNLRGDRGEFFTPRNICRMTTDMLFSLIEKERLTRPGAIKILDPAVGTGGFLISPIQRIKEMLTKRGYKYDKLREFTKEVAERNFFGIDFNPFLVKVAQMNMVMHGDGSSNMVHANSLEHPALWSDEVLLKLFGAEIKKYRGLSRFREHLETLEKPEEIEEAISVFDMVVTNPPFGTKAIVDDIEILSLYEITTFGASSPRTSLPPEQLFIERCLQFLIPGGFLGIVLPDSILGNPGLDWLRKWILKRTYVIASIDFPTEMFEPHTGTQTSVLILKKKTQEQMKLQEEYEIFMAIPERVGKDRRGNPIYMLTPDRKIELDKKGLPVIDDHLPIVAKVFDEWISKKGLK